MFDRRAQQCDFAWFRRNPDRRTFVRLASEIEEITARELAGIPADDHRICTVFVVRLDADCRRQLGAIFVPAFYTRPLRLPADETTCAALFEEID